LSEIPCPNPTESPYENGKIEVHLTAEAMHRCLLNSLQRTRRRAAGLMEDLLRAVHEPRPDMERIRLLADGVAFEGRLARQIGCELATITDDCPDWRP
jgi:hypothetical protein